MNIFVDLMKFGLDFTVIILNNKCYCYYLNISILLQDNIYYYIYIYFYIIKITMFQTTSKILAIII